jgi:hypothetical protein
MDLCCYFLVILLFMSILITVASRSLEKHSITNILPTTATQNQPSRKLQYNQASQRYYFPDFLRSIAIVLYLRDNDAFFLLYLTDYFEFYSYFSQKKKHPCLHYIYFNYLFFPIISKSVLVSIIFVYRAVKATRFLLVVVISMRWTV